MRVLALVPGGVTEQLLFFPTLETLKQKYPSVVIDVLVEPRSKSTYRICPLVHEVLMFDYRDQSGLADYLNVLGIIRDREYDVAINLSRNWTLSFLLWLNGIPVRVAYGTTSSWFVSNPVTCGEDSYLATVNHNILKGLDIDSNCPPLKISLPKEDIEWAQNQQKLLGLDGGYIIIQGDSGDNEYPVSSWTRIIDDIRQKQPHLSIVLLPGVIDPNWIGQMQQKNPDVKDIEPPDIGKLAALIAGANLLLCGDSVALQLAVAVGTYTVALFGDTSKQILLPPAHDRYTGIQSPSYKLGDITPEAILQQMWKN
ncbi:MAG: Lipopolysaccharide core heptosyltransferase RfaQ [Chroococcopsis gigantea SAG 12.99]|jgi:ADP-heptose:LPS heptosyltransferase|nr:glycosyltransferase family 9 protein [Chlorogloea purpurea SAG 13.99]MDV3001499.1 Lipopolysaccharide core heptosyltransferase RfaQ [Chroococcopsis gigantea SAG 12.99]